MFIFRPLQMCFSLASIADGGFVQDTSIDWCLQPCRKNSVPFSGVEMTRALQILQISSLPKDIDEAAKLEEVQKAAKKEPLQLVKPVATRWNSVYDSHRRMVCPLSLCFTG